MISKLKVECGFNTVSKLSRMFTDMDLSKNVMREFKTKVSNGEHAGVKIQADILTGGIWPEQNTHAVKLPPILVDCSQKFEMFYKNKHSGRHLQWLHGQSTTLINPTYTGDKVYGLTTSVYQTAILLLFNEHEVLTVSQIMEQTNLTKKEIDIQLKYLCNPKQRVLNKQDLKKPVFKESEEIKVNMAFKNPALRVNLVPKKTHKKKTATEKGEVQLQVEQETKMERQHVLDAIIVRIMKARKTETHTLLLQEVMK